MNKTTYVGLDVHKDTIAVAVAEEGRRGETRFFGTIAHTADSVLRLTKQLAAAGNTPSFCYDAVMVCIDISPSSDSTARSLRPR